MSDPCSGHECDSCPKCLNGRCCRREPGYALPQEGSWQPMVGTIGVRNTNGDQMECHICGEWFANVGVHATRKHDVTAPEYRALFGLTRAGLAGENLRDRARAKARALYEAGRTDTEEWRRQQYRTGMTKEQRRQNRSSAEGRRRLAEGWAILHEARAATPIVRATVYCAACGRPRDVWPSAVNRYKSCGAPECRRAAKVAGGIKSRSGTKGVVTA